MSIRKQILHPQTLRHFKLPGNPSMKSTAPTSSTREQLRTRAQLLDACKRGGFVAVVGESGSGKTTLRRDLQERVQRADMPIQIIRPYVVGMESDDVRARRSRRARSWTRSWRRSRRTSPAVQQRCAVPPAGESPQGKSPHGHAPRGSHRRGTCHAQGHAAPPETLRRARGRVLAPLERHPARAERARRKARPRDPSVREVVQRCEIITLPPLGEHLEDYLRFRLKRFGVDLAKIVTADGLQALRERLSPPVPRAPSAHSCIP